MAIIIIYQISLLGHIQRMPDERMPITLLKSKPEGTRMKGRPRKPCPYIAGGAEVLEGDDEELLGLKEVRETASLKGTLQSPE